MAQSEESVRGVGHGPTDKLVAEVGGNTLALRNTAHAAKTFANRLGAARTLSKFGGMFGRHPDSSKQILAPKLAIQKPQSA